MGMVSADRNVCPQCSGQVAARQSFCNNCGADLRPAVAATVQCPYCATPAPVGARFCPGCGRDMQAEPPRDRPCPYCNAPIAAGQAFCTGCGGLLKPVAPPIAPGGPTPPAQPPAPFPSPPPRRSWVLPVVGVGMLLLVLLCGVCAFSVYNAENVVAGIVNGGDPANEGKRAPTYAQILEVRKQKPGDQWQQYLNSLQGMQAVDWTGQVYDVQQSVAGSAVLVVALDNPNGTARPNVNIPFVDGSALKVRKGQSVRFTGRINYALDLLGIVTFTMDNATVYY